MLTALKSGVRATLHKLDLDILRRQDSDRIMANAAASRDLAFISALPDSCLRPALELLPLSTAQLRQDIFALSETGFKKNGYFVEFGATDGKTLSNTWMLEKKFGWHGILAEPAKVWKNKLTTERNAELDFECVWSKSGEHLEFIETDYAELSTVASHSGTDHHANSRKKANKYSVKTISLTDLLKRHNAPSNIDYLSIDTEGSEYDILSAFDFSSYRFAVITCEHNFTANREKLHNLLTSHGYRRKYEEISQFDDWYVFAD